MSNTRQEQEELLKLLTEKELRVKYNYIKTLFPDTGPLRRELYKQHIKFFEAGAYYIDRAIISANQVGKSTAGLYEMVLHATGLYDVIAPWWNGKRFNKPIIALLAGDRGEVIRDSLQKKLLGEDPTDTGTGLIPKDCIVDLKTMEGIPGGIAQYFIKHYNSEGVVDGTSQIITRTYRAGRNAFEAITIDFFMLDEECPRDILNECFLRIISKQGAGILTFTPDSGITDTVEYYLDSSDGKDKSVTNITWDDVPHLSEEYKQALIDKMSPDELECRTKGIPYLGRGKIYNIPESSYVRDPLREIPKHWPRVFALDVGYQHATAAVWCAYDRESDIIYIYSEYKSKNTLPLEHADNILSRGKWIPGVIDTQSSEVSPTDGNRLVDMYAKYGIELYPVKKGAGSVEEGILEVYQRLASGRLIIASNLSELLREIRLYRRKDDGRIHKENDDIMDALRYLVTNGLRRSVTEFEYYNSLLGGDVYTPNYNSDSITGY